MKSQGAGVKERIDFLTAEGRRAHPDFTIEDAYDAERDVLSARLESITELDHAVRQLTSSWQGSPLGDDELEAGGALLEHLAELVKQAKSRELRSESELLSQVWTWGPDISGTWPWLTAWQDPRVKELAADAPLEVIEVELDDPGRARYELRREEVAVSHVEVAKIAHRDMRPRVEDWTRALRDVTLEKWVFRLESDGHVAGHGPGHAWLWGLESDELGSSYAKLEFVQFEPGRGLVRLSASSPRLREEGDEVRQLERELDDREWFETNLDPTQLVQEALGPR